MLNTEMVQEGWVCATLIRRCETNSLVRTGRTLDRKQSCKGCILLQYQTDQQLHIIRPSSASCVYLDDLIMWVYFHKGEVFSSLPGAQETVPCPVSTGSVKDIFVFYYSCYILSCFAIKYPRRSSSLICCKTTCEAGTRRSRRCSC